MMPEASQYNVELSRTAAIHQPQQTLGVGAGAGFDRQARLLKHARSGLSCSFHMPGTLTSLAS